MGQENRMSVRPFVRTDNNYFLRTESWGGTHAAGPWWFGLWISEDRKRTLHLFALATGIGRLRDPFLNTVSETFPQVLSKKEDPLDPS